MAVNRAVLLVVIVAAAGVAGLFTAMFTLADSGSKTTGNVEDQRHIEGLYAGVEQDEGMVTIDNQQYYMTTVTAIDSVARIPRGADITFHDVEFSFPRGSLLTPAGVAIVFEVVYPDNTIEKFGKVAVGNGTGGFIDSAIFVSSLPGAKVPEAATVLGKHQDPNAGITVYNQGEQIKLLVSAG